MPFAAKGDPDALFNMGQAYKLGRGVPLDKAKAEDFYRRAADKGHAPAQSNLGILLAQRGEKVQAAELWQKGRRQRRSAMPAHSTCSACSTSTVTRYRKTGRWLMLT
jgi:TPR repeat protein